MLLNLLKSCVICFILNGCAATVPAQLLTLDKTHTQAIIVSRQHLTLWQNKGQWQKVYAHVPVVVGRNGLAPIGQKREGDGRTPSGIYALKTAFGYAPTLDTGLDYHQAGKDDFWVDDIKSPQYNQWVHGVPNAISYESMQRDDKLYKIGAVIEYNTNPITAGDGSAIFMHIWRRHDHPTAGCVAMSERHLRKILKHLNSTNHPVIILEN